MPKVAARSAGNVDENWLEKVWRNCNPIEGACTMLPTWQIWGISRFCNARGVKSDLILALFLNVIHVNAWDVRPFKFTPRGQGYFISSHFWYSKLFLNEDEIKIIKISGFIRFGATTRSSTIFDLELKFLNQFLQRGPQILSIADFRTTTKDNFVSAPLKWQYIQSCFFSQAITIGTKLNEVFFTTVMGVISGEIRNGLMAVGKRKVLQLFELLWIKKTYLGPCSRNE